MRVDRRVAAIIVVTDMGKIHGFTNARHLVDIAQEAVKVRIIADPVAIAFEMRNVHRVKSHQRGPQAKIGFGQLVPRQLAVFTQ